MLSFNKDRAFAQELAAAIATQVSSKLLRDNRKAMSVNKITRVLEKTYLQVRNYQTEQRMGFLRRSLFANNFQWALKELAYPQDFVVMATEGLVLAVARKPAAASRENAR